MCGDHTPSSHETRPFLNQQPPSYGSTAAEVPTRGHPDPPQVVSTADQAWILAGLWSGVMLGGFDGTVAATLLTPIGSEFNTSHKASYIGSAYLLSVCCFTPLYGRLSDIMGRKVSMLIAIFLFGMGTVWCGLAGSMNSFIAGRIIAGMGGGGVMTVASITVTDLIPLRKRAAYQGYANLLYGIGAGLGGPMGGWANDNMEWRWAFYMQIPVLIFSFVVVAWKVNIRLSNDIQHRPLSDKLRRIDVLGLTTLAGAVGCLLVTIDLGTTDEVQWTNPLYIFVLSGSFFFTFTFIMTEKYWAPYPIIPLRLLLQRGPLAVSLSSLLLTMSIFSMLYCAPIFFITVRSLSPSVSGLHLLPFSICIPLGSLAAGWYMWRQGKLYWLTLHAAWLTILGSLLAICWNENTPEYHLWLDVLPQSLGFSCFITTSLLAIISVVRKEDMAVAIGMTYLFRTTGQVFGVSLSGSILQSVLRKQLSARIHGPGSEEIIYEIRHSAQIIPTLEPHIQQAAIESYSDALRAVFICQAAIGVLGFLACIPIQETLVPNSLPERERADNNLTTQA